jgi:hypothetical protein
MKTRDLVQDESLGLNMAWYADILMTLTAPGTVSNVDGVVEATGGPALA